eukprot:TRINITY_DN11421_c0_g4_i3.p1 TRINITY_DN11421_c0_g4~~TRINITY_DN11421_c0_g4_i3.p1  ORF type:complete len:857 (-),score=216.68 TRINITY_DN11421_c0_g4_i3:53-2623(-)
MKSVIEIKADETADMLLDRTWKKFPQSKEGKDKEDFVLCVAGKAEYIAGPHLVFMFDYVQRAHQSGIPLPLTLKSAEQFKKNSTEEDKYIFEVEEQSLSTDPVIKYDHRLFARVQHKSQNNHLVRLSYYPQSLASTPRIFHDPAPQDVNIISVWDIHQYFKVKVCGCMNIVAKQPSTYQSVLVNMQVVHGDVLLCPPQETQAVVFYSQQTFNEYLSIPIALANLPRVTKFCFTLYAIKKNKARNPLAWVNFLLYDYKNELRTGKFSLKMWSGDAANIIGTCVENTQPTNDSSVPTELVIEMDEIYPSKDGVENIFVFPTEPLDYPPYSVGSPPPPEDVEKLEKIIKHHSLDNLEQEDKDLIWKYRRTYCIKYPAALPKFLMSCCQTDRIAVQEMHQLLEEWAPINPVDALELLDARYADPRVREYAVRNLDRLSTAEVEDYLLQLVQVIKYEPYHDSALARFLLKRAIRNKRIGHFLYWFLKSEIHQSMVSERFGLMLEAFLKGGGDARKDISAQESVLGALHVIAYGIKGMKDQKDTMPFFKQELVKLNSNWPPNCQLSLDPSFITSGIIVDRCKIMDSKMKPLWLLFQNADPLGANMNVIFKAGDDLRQDMLTLQMFRIMDKMWKKHDIDLQLRPYNVIATGAETGMIEVVTSSNTISKIQKAMAGPLGAFQDDVIFNWLKAQNPTNTEIINAVENFTASCAGYCVATYVLGIGDRHNDNIMIQSHGRLFHIDFGHILGNFKEKFGVKRERVPFVFTPDWAFVMGGKDSPYYEKFKANCKMAHEILQENFKLFINLFSMMIISGMPELTSKEDIRIIVDTLTIGEDCATFQDILEKTGSQLSTRVNWFFHSLVH